MSVLQTSPMTIGSWATQVSGMKPLLPCIHRAMSGIQCTDLQGVVRLGQARILVCHFIAVQHPLVASSSEACWPGSVPLPATQVAVHLGAVNQENSKQQFDAKALQQQGCGHAGCQRGRGHVLCTDIFFLSNAKLCICSICLSWWWKVGTSKS